MSIPNENMDMNDIILAIQDSDDQTLVAVWKSVSSGGNFVKMDPKLLKAFYDEFERRPGLLASISESQILNSRLVELAGIKHRSSLLLEEDDELFGADEEDEEKDEEKDDAEDGEEDGGDDAEDAEDDPADEPEEVPEKLSAKEVSELGPGEIDLEIDTVMSDIFDKSQKAFDAALQAESIHRKSMSSLLFENADYEKFDMDRFAREVARYINNYTTLMDIEGMLFNKAKTTLLNQFGDLGKTAVSEFEEHMARVHGIDFTDKFEDDIIQQPVAVGSGSTGA